ncbi:VanZ family protein [Bacteroidota bacterium]
MSGKKNYIFSPLLNLILFDMLLVATPFLMLQNYLQLTIKELSRISIDFSIIEVPVVLIMAFILILLLIIFNYKKITLFRLSAILFVVVMMIVGQETADYYMSNKFYDLQHNWHYFAYGLFAFVMYRYLITKKVTYSQMIIATFFKALLISLFDEGIQVFISDRVFDISDIAKDIWGVVMGLIILFFVLLNGGIIRKGWKIRQQKLKNYLSSPLSLLFLELILAYILLFISSILTEDIYWYAILLWTVPLFLIVFLILHYSSFKYSRLIFIISFLIILSVQGFMFVRNYDYDITECSKGFVLYKGIPLVYFDYMIYPDGTFRPVDKKKWFKGGDFTTMFNQKADIILIGKGFDGSGGLGFRGTQFVEHPYFIFNFITKKNSQVVLLDTPAACREFNRLKKENKKVLFVIHNS